MSPCPELSRRTRGDSGAVLASVPGSRTPKPIGGGGAYESLRTLTRGGRGSVPLRTPEMSRNRRGEDDHRSPRTPEMSRKKRGG